MSSLKLDADTGGGAVSLDGPASTTGNASVSLKLPVADGSSGQFLKTDGSGNLGWGTDVTTDSSKLPLSGGTLTGDLTVPDKIIHAGDTNTSIRFPAVDTASIETNGTERLRITSGGLIHLGYNASSSAGLAAVNVVGAGHGILVARSQSGNVTDGQDLGSIGFKGYISGNHTGAADARIDASADGNHSGTAAGSYIRFWTKPTTTGPGSAPTERLRIDSNGDVTIGTTSWSYPKPLNVQGSSGAILALSNYDTTSYASDTNTSIEFRLNTGNTGNQNGACEIRAFKENGTNGNNARGLNFWTAGNGGSPAERLRITSAGKVLIGTNTPQGNANADDLVVSSGGTTGISIRAGGTSYDSNIFFARGTSGTDEYRGWITYDHTDQFMTLGTNGQEIVRASTGTFGIGCTPSRTLHVKGPHDCHLAIQVPGTTQTSALLFGDSASDSVGSISYGHSDDSMAFTIGGSENARFTPGGCFLAKANGTGYDTSNTTAFHQFVVSQGYGFICKLKNDTWGYGLSIKVHTGSSREGLMIYDTDNSQSAAAILMNGTYDSRNNDYGAFSDVKLKENIVDAKSQWDDVKAIRFRNFNFKKDDPSKKMLGVIAQELESISPGLVEDIADKEEDSEGNRKETGEVTKHVRYSVLYMKGIKALQEAMAKIETLETKVAALESA